MYNLVWNFFCFLKYVIKGSLRKGNYLIKTQCFEKVQVTGQPTSLR